MANFGLISMEELSTWKLCLICQQIGKGDLEDPMTKKMSFPYCINKYSISVFVFVLSY